jgi:hypothetical protein
MRSLWPEEEELRGRDGQAWVESFSVVPEHVQSAARRIVWWDFVSLHTMDFAMKRGFGVFNRAVKDYAGSAPTNEEIVDALVAVGYSKDRALKRVGGVI